MTPTINAMNKTKVMKNMIIYLVKWATNKIEYY